MCAIALLWACDATGIPDTRPASWKWSIFTVSTIALSTGCAYHWLFGIDSSAHIVLPGLATLVELAQLPPVPKCTTDAEPSVHCLQGTSYASAFGVGSAAPRTAVTHQWPYSTYLGDAKGLLSNSTPGVPGVAYNGNCSTLAGIQWKTKAQADVALASCPKTMVRT